MYGCTDVRMYRTTNIKHQIQCVVTWPVCRSVVVPYTVLHFALGHRTDLPFFLGVVEKKKKLE
jgi:hypothetical protein